MKSFKIEKNDADQRLDKYLLKSFPNLPKALMYKYIRKKRIKINGKKADISTRLALGDIVELYINDEFFEKAPDSERFDFLHAGKQLDIIYEDDNIILLNKKKGLLCHPDDREYVDTLIGRVKRYLYEKGEYKPDEETSFVPSLANRIDRNTSGIVIACKTAEALRVMNQKIKDREIKKLYLALVHGKMKKKTDVLEGYLFKDEKNNRVFVSDTQKPGSKYIKTAYRVIKEIGDTTLLEIDLLTGRTHQIRAHLAYIGHPLVGDGKYGKFEGKGEKYFRGQCLCSHKLTFTWTTDAGSLSYLNGKSFQIDKSSLDWFFQSI